MYNFNKLKLQVDAEEDVRVKDLVGFLQNQTFMSRWIAFFKLFSIFYLFVSMLGFLSITIYLIATKEYTDSELIFEKYKALAEEEAKKIQEESTEIFEDVYNENLNMLLEKLPSPNVIYFISIAFYSVLIMMIPNAFLIYRSRLVTLSVFTEVKKNELDKKGENYKWYY